MDPSIEKLKSTTFSGRRLTREQILDVKETVELMSSLSRKELCRTICEHLNWVTAKGNYRISACLNMLKVLEQGDVLILPKKQENMARFGPRAEPVWSKASDPQPEISGRLSDLQPLQLERVTDTAGRHLWNALVTRHHYLGYRKPYGQHLRYFLVDNQGRKLGCLLFEAATSSLPCREKWVGWSDRRRNRFKHLVVQNSRYLIFPWVKVKYLASSGLAMTTRQLRHDWFEQHGYRPVLCESYVDESRFTGACYRAANWLRIGATSGHKAKTVKGVYVLPLCSDSCEILRGDCAEPQPEKPLSRAQKGRAAGQDRRFLQQWEMLIAAATAVAEQEDARWQRRRRVFSSLLIMLFVFRLVLAPRNQGYRSTLCELWQQCADAGVTLPQVEPPAASSICEAREKLDEAAFKRLHSTVLAHSTDDLLWKGHRIFAVDGSKFTLPPKLAEKPWRRPHDNAHYPQGMISTLYRLRARIPVDFDLFKHENERKAALTHLDHLNEGDLVVYDRGYWSFEMAQAHYARKLNFVFRLKRKANAPFDAFIDSDRTDQVIDLDPPDDNDTEYRWPCRVRLVKYTVLDTTYFLATSLIDSAKYKIPALSDLYHGRWSIEELYKVSKILTGQFHGKSERGVRQELYAGFTLIAINRMFTNRCDADMNCDDTDDRPPMQTNFMNGLRLIGREIETLFLQQSQFVRASVPRIMTGLSQCYQCLRPGQSYDRESKQPRSKWQK